MARQKRGWLSLGWVFSYPLFAVLAAMIYLTGVEMAQPPRQVVRVAPAVVDSPDWATGFGPRVEALHEQVKLALVAPLDATIASEEPRGASAVRWTHRLVEVSVDPKRRADVDASLAALGAADPGVSVVTEETFNGTQALIGLDGLLTHTVRVIWSDRPVRPRAALVVLALGDDLRLAREVIELEPPVAVAVLPFRPFSAQVAELARMFDREALLQWNDAAAQRGLDAALATVPGAIGVAVRDPDTAPVGEMSERRLLVLVADGERGDGSAAAGDTVPFVAEISLRGEEAAFTALTQKAQAVGRAVGLARGVQRGGLEPVREMLARWTEQEIDVVAVSQIYGGAPAPAEG